MEKYDKPRINAARGQRRGDMRLAGYRVSHKYAVQCLAGLLIMVFALVTASTGTAQTKTPDRLWKLYPVKVPDKQEPSAPPAQKEQRPAGVAPSETSGGDRPDTDTSTKSRTQLLVTVAGLGLLALGLLLLLANFVGLPTPRRPGKRNRDIDLPRGVTLPSEFNKGTSSLAPASADHGNEKRLLQKGTADSSAKTPGNSQAGDGESPPEHQKEIESSNLRPPDLQEAVETEGASVARESEQMFEEVPAEMNEEQGDSLQVAAEDAAVRTATVEEHACETVVSYARATKDSTRQATDEMVNLVGEHAQKATSTVEAEIEQSGLVVENGCEEAKAAVIEILEAALAVLDDAARTLADKPSLGTSIENRLNSARSWSERALVSIDSHAARAQALIAADGRESLMAIRVQPGEIRALADSRVARTAAAIEAASERARAAIHAETASGLVAVPTEGGFPNEAQATSLDSARTAEMTTLERQIRTHVEVARAVIDAHAEEGRSAISTTAAGMRSSIQAETERAGGAISKTAEDTAQTVNMLVDEIREAVGADIFAVASELERQRMVERTRALMEEEITRTRAAMEDELERTIASIQATVEKKLAAMRTQDPFSPSDDASVTRLQHGEPLAEGSEAELTEDLTLAAIKEAAEATAQSFRAEAGRAVEVVTAEITAGLPDVISQPTGTSAGATTEALDEEGGSSRKLGRKRRRHGRPR